MHVTSLLVLAAMAIACVSPAPTPAPNTLASRKHSADLAKMTIRGRVLLPVTLVSVAGGALISNNAGGLVARRGADLVGNNSGNLVGNNASNYRLPRSVRQLLVVLEQKPVADITVVLADATGEPFKGLKAVQTDAKGNFSIPNVPKGLTYTVQAQLPTPKGDIRVATLAASDKAVTISLASTVALDALKPKTGSLWGSVDETILARATGVVTQGLGDSDVQLVFLNSPTEQKGQVLARLQSQSPELKADLDTLATQLAQVPKNAEALALQLRSQPDEVASTPPSVQPTPDVSWLPSTGPSPTPSSPPSLVTRTPGHVQVTTLAGSIMGYAEGTGVAAQFAEPIGVAADTAGNVYVADTLNHRIRKLSPTGVVTTLAGSKQGYADGTGTAAMFFAPGDVVVDAFGNVYVADAGNSCIRKVSPAGVVTTLAGSKQGYADGTGAAAMFSGPGGVDVDAFGNVYVADTMNHRIRKITVSQQTLEGG